MYYYFIIIFIHPSLCIKVGPLKEIQSVIFTTECDYAYTPPCWIISGVRYGYVYNPKFTLTLTSDYSVVIFINSSKS